MFYVFNTELAERFGVEEATILQNLIFWINHNKKNNRNYHEGKYWTYNSIKNFKKIFYFWSEGQIRRILNNLLKQNIIKKGRFNNDSRNTTLWYTFTDEYEYFLEKYSSVKIKVHRPSEIEKEEFLEIDEEYILSETTNAIVETNKCNCQNQQTQLSETTNAIVDSNLLETTNAIADFEDEKDNFQKNSTEKQNSRLSISKNALYTDNKPTDKEYIYKHTDDKHEDIFKEKYCRVSAKKAEPLSLVKEIVDYLNKVCGTRYKPTSKKTISLIKARLVEGFTLEDFKTVIDKKFLLWGNDLKMMAYLRPETLFGTKFESYLNEIVTKGKVLYAKGYIDEKTARGLNVVEEWVRKDTDDAVDESKNNLFSISLNDIPAEVRAWMKEDDNSFSSSPNDTQTKNKKLDDLPPIFKEWLSEKEDVGSYFSCSDIMQGLVAKELGRDEEGAND